MANALAHQPNYLRRIRRCLPSTGHCFLYFTPFSISHRTIIIMKKLLFLLFSLFASHPLFAHGISDADKQSMIDGGYLEYVWLGASHMIQGYDHLLFLFGVIFFLTRFKDILKFITAFTLGHCITLIFATFMEISANYFLVDAVIALTVIYKGFDNLGGFKKWFNRESPNLLFLVFLFGLIHGFGLSTRLQQLPLGDDGLLLKILSFNLGVEIGQIGALAIMLTVLNTCRKRVFFPKFSLASNVGLVIAGTSLFVFQVYGYVTEPTHADRPLAQVEQTQKSTDYIELTIPANGSMEYKFHIAKDAKFDYSWSTDGGRLFFDFHGEPEGDTTGYFKSYEKTTDIASKGTFAPQFTGSHGWYWKNKTSKPVTVKLTTNGVYTILGVR
jgi:hypothetical protein